MIFDPLTNALYDDSGRFTKTVFCPMALRPEQLDALHLGDQARYCRYCRKEIVSMDHISDEEVRALVARDPHACVFSTPAATNIRFLSPSAGHAVSNPGSLPSIITLRSLPAMEFAAESGFRLVFRDVGPSQTFGESKFLVYQETQTGKIWWSGDYRFGFPPVEDDGSRRDYRLLRAWFNARSDLHFPLGAYAVSPNIAAGQRVYITEVLEDVPIEWWNQGDAVRLTSCTAVWNGSDLELDVPKQPPTVLG